MYSRNELLAAWRGVLAHHAAGGDGDAGDLRERHAAFLQNEIIDPQPVARVAVPKAGGGVRWLDVLDPHEEAVYRAATARVAWTVEARLGPGVVANRVDDPSPALRLEPWRRARRRFVRAAMPTEGAGVIALADVRDCYASITPVVVEESLLGLGCERGAVAGLGLVLRRLGDRGVAGLPVGPEASAVLANAVLARADRAVAGEGCRHVRWVDDFVIEAPDRRAATRVLGRLARALERLGLDVAPHKSRVEDAREPGRRWEGVSRTAR